MEFELSFKPIIDDLGHFLPNQLGSKIMAYTKGDFPNLAEADLVIFCVPGSSMYSLAKKKGLISGLILFLAKCVE